MNRAVRDYITVTAAYWGFTITDGALRMLVVLYFHQLGYGALDIALLFLFYEFFGVVTNLFGGWLGARWGLNRTMMIGLLLQVLVLVMLAQQQWLSIIYVMVLQALSGIAKDLNKMSAKSSLKSLLPEEPIGGQSRLFKWVAILTGSKNALKGVGFFLGGLLLALLGYAQSLYVLAAGLAITSITAWLLLPRDMGSKGYKPKFSEIFSKSQSVNRLSAARFFLFGARDIWFVVALPVFLQQALNWHHAEVGTMMALWVIGYGIVQSATPKLLGFAKQASSGSASAQLSFWALAMTLVPLLMLGGNAMGLSAFYTVVVGLLGFAVVFAINSALHSYWIIALARAEGASMDVGFYYMANAGGRLAGTVLSGAIYQFWGFWACILGSALMLALASVISRTIVVEK